MALHSAFNVQLARNDPLARTRIAAAASDHACEHETQERERRERAGGEKTRKRPQAREEERKKERERVTGNESGKGKGTHHPGDNPYASVRRHA